MSRGRMPAIPLAFSLFLTGCVGQQLQSSSPPEPDGKWVMKHEELYQKMERGEITRAELSHRFTVDKNACNVESMKVSIPSPSCTQPPKQSCAGLSGFALGFCQSYTPPVQCDYSSVNAAKRAQGEVFKSCMRVSGWKPVWKPATPSSE